jgi:L-asparaginase / beta-aspartyl-peptidase
MFRASILLALLLTIMTTNAVAADKARWAIAIHGGAGGLPHDLPAAELERIRQALQDALKVGSDVLRAGGNSLDAVQAVVRIMENSRVLNAGRGAVLNHEGFAELDAALMDGRDRRSGAVAALRHVANPIDLARAVMDHSPHVLLVGDGAEQFAQEQGMPRMPSDYFITERRRKELEKTLEAAKHPTHTASIPWQPVGTVGAVALDSAGNLAAATSTGGTVNKHVGRVGDSPLIGAGTFAQNGVCAVSATGQGEYFIRYTAASDVCARIQYQHKSLETAAREVITELKAAGGEGGLIAIDANGTIAMPHSSATMLRGQASSSQPPEVVVEVPQ